MKKIVTGIFAMIIAVSAMAQTTGKPTDAGTETEKHSKHFKKDEFSKLNLSSDQKAQMKSISQSYRQQLKDVSKNTTDPAQQKANRQALMQERKQKMMAVLTPDQQKQAEKMKDEYKSEKKDGKHEDRLNSMTKNLNLTTDQTAKVASLNSAFKSNIESIKNNSSLSADERKEQMKSAFKTHKSDLNAILTEQQRAQLKNNRRNHSDGSAVK